MKPLEKIWMNGEMLPWNDAKVHVTCYTLHYGVAAFEGIRAYKLADGRTGVFRLKEHMQRLYDSGKLVLMNNVQWPLDQSIQACLDTIKANHMDECYIRPLLYYGPGDLGVGKVNQVELAIMVWEWGAYLGKDGLEKGISCKTTSYVRPHPASGLPKGKLAGNYITGFLAKWEAWQDGYAEAIMFDTEGFVSEGTGENLFVILNKIIYTTPYSSPVLGGITRETIMQLARDLGYEVRESLISREMMLLADELFFTGTAAEVTPIAKVDHHTIGAGVAGPITKDIQQNYMKMVRGEFERYNHWITIVE